MRDYIFFCAPGEWTLYKCSQCSSAYLDPRPTAETIGLAYETYFTHGDLEQTTKKGLSRINQLSRNAYVNMVWNTNLEPFSRKLAWIQRAIPGNAAYIDNLMRHLPRPAQDRQLLDVGCGNGSFLLMAKSAGWNVAGFDVDLKAVQLARSHDLDVLAGSFDNLGREYDGFDVITLSHVIEHVHLPLKLLQDCRKLLRPGGSLWIETPNIESAGHTKFGKSWRGLEVPRHLTIFSRSSLIDLLKKAGFGEVRDAPWSPARDIVWPVSKAIADGSLRPIEARADYISRLLYRMLDYVSSRNPSNKEFITLIAH